MTLRTCNIKNHTGFMPEVSSIWTDKNKCVLALTDCCNFIDPHHTKLLPLKVQLYCSIKFVLGALYIWNLHNHLCKKTITKAMSIWLLDMWNSLKQNLYNGEHTSSSQNNNHKIVLTFPGRRYLQNSHIGRKTHWPLWWKWTLTFSC